MRVFLILISFLGASLSKDMNRESPLVEVRGVFINCEPAEREDISMDNEALRFEREELFKHSVLQDCNKKIAFTVKIASDPNNIGGDEYIPIEHVFQGQNKRVRLLNPYVLRLQRGPLLQAYKLRKMATVDGLMDNTNSNFVQREDQHIVSNARDRSRSKNYDRISNNLKDSENKPDYELTNNNSALKNNACLKKRNKRRELNMVVEDASKVVKHPQWITEALNVGELNKNTGSSNDFYKTSSFVTLPYKKIVTLHGNFEDALYSNNVERYPNDLMRHSKPWGSLANENYITESGSPRDLKAESDWGLDEIPDTHNKGSDNKYHTEFDMYEIGNPDLLFTVKVQLFEKLTTPDGKTVWNDITKDEPLSMSTLSPEWAGRDISIRYRTLEWIPREMFTLPTRTASLYLLTPTNSRKLSESDYVTSNNGKKYIVVPKEDIFELQNEDVNLKKRQFVDNSSSMESSTEVNEQQPRRRIMIRTTRALFGGNEDNFSIALDGSGPLLTMPHRRLHHVQIDLEARADDNVLVPVGSSGRIMTVVSDNSRRTRTTLTVQVTNTGLAAAKFRTVARDCGPDFMGSQMNDGETVRGSPIVIPPRHTRSIRLDVPFIPAEIFHCLVTLVNKDDVSVAVRDVTVKKGDRCFCVWHCECTCLSEDPKLLCHEMSEAGQVAAGLSLHEGRRHVRSVCYHDVVSINMLVTAFGVLLILLCLGLVKAFLGLINRCVGSWGLHRIVQMPRQIERYYESSLRDSPVVYDKEGWPVHPETKKRTVRCISKSMEFILNIIFFITTPCITVYDLLKEICSRVRNTDTWRPNGCDQKCYNSTHDFQNNKSARQRRRRGYKKWMSPEAEDLSTKVLLEGLRETAVMQPLLHQSCLYDHDHSLQQSCVDAVDSEGDETEYVLMQMQKSKESLAKNQREFNDVEK